MPLTPRDRWNLERHLLVVQDLAPSTVQKTLLSLRVLEREGLDLAAPDRVVYETAILRRKRRGARGTALQHLYKAMRRLLRFHGLRWSDLPCPRAVEPDVHVPDDVTVSRALTYGSDRECREVPHVRFAFEFGFYTAIRPPSEHVAVRLRDFDRDAGTLRVWSSKVGRARVLRLEPWLTEGVAAYVDGPRESVDRGISSSLILRPGGRPWTPNAYRMWLHRHGRRVHEHWRNYGMRHWGATYRLIQTGFDLLAVQAWLGHRRLATTQRYVHVAAAIQRDRMRTHHVQPLNLATG